MEVVALKFRWLNWYPLLWLLLSRDNSLLYLKIWLFGRLRFCWGLSLGPPIMFTLRILFELASTLFDIVAFCKLAWVWLSEMFGKLICLIYKCCFWQLLIYRSSKTFKSVYLMVIRVFSVIFLWKVYIFVWEFTIY